MNLTDLQEVRKRWKDIPLEVVPKDKVEVFKQRKQAVDMYIDGFTLKEIEEETGIYASRIFPLVKRCMQFDADGNFYGYTALLPGIKIDEMGNSVPHEFGKLLQRYPALADFIEGNWFGNAKYTRKKNMSLAMLHEMFLDECIRVGVPDFGYPFNRKKRGYHALRDYIQHLEKEHLIKSASRQSKDNQQKIASTGYGKRYTRNAVMPYSVVQGDGHILDVLYTVEYLNIDGTIDRKVATRAWLFPIFDVATRCVIGYTVSQEFNYNQYDLLAAVKKSILPHKEMKFTVPGYEYPENGGFPSMAIPELQNAIFDTIMLDNAKSHLSKLSIDRLTNGLKASVDFGSVATPETRGIVERFFGTLESRGFHRLTITTGSNSKSAERLNPDKKALEKAVSFEQICELLEILIAQYNNTPHSSLNGLTPLECLERRVKQSGLMPSIADEEMLKMVEKLDYINAERTVRGGKNGKRPYIHYMNVDYRCPELSTTGMYLGRKVQLLINPKDISQIEAYDENGQYIGLLMARGEYGTTSHSLKTRKLAEELARERKISKDNLFYKPISQLEDHLDEQAKTSRRAATRRDIVRREQKIQEFNTETSIAEKLEKAVPDDVEPFYSAAKNKKQEPRIPTAEEIKNIPDTTEYINHVWGKVLK